MPTPDPLTQLKARYKNAEEDENLQSLFSEEKPQAQPTTPAPARGVRHTMRDGPEQGPVALTPEEQAKEAMPDPAYRDKGNWRHAEALQRVHELATQAWPDPPVPAQEAAALSVRPSVRLPAPSMLVTGPAARALWEAQQRAAATRYLADPGSASPELRAVVWSPQNMDALMRMILAALGRL